MCIAGKGTSLFPHLIPSFYSYANKRARNIPLDSRFTQNKEQERKTERKTDLGLESIGMVGLRRLAVDLRQCVPAISNFVFP